MDLSSKRIIVTGCARGMGAATVRAYVRGEPVIVRDFRLADAMTLSEHPAWSQRDLDEMDQDVLDHLDLIRHEQAAEKQRAEQLAEHERRAAEAARRRG